MEIIKYEKPNPNNIYKKKFIPIKRINFNAYEVSSSFYRNIEKIDFGHDIYHDILLYEWNSSNLDWDIKSLKE